MYFPHLFCRFSYVETVPHFSNHFPTNGHSSLFSLFHRNQHYNECACMLSCFSRVHLFATLWTSARQAPLSMGFSRQGYWSGVPCSPPGDLPDPGIRPTSLMSPALAGSATWEAPGKVRILFSPAGANSKEITQANNIIHKYTLYNLIYKPKM